jgi:hypothetical protein
MSTPEARIQSGMEYQMRPRGSPEEKESRATDAVRHDRIAVARLWRAPGFFGGAGGVAGGAWLIGAL